MDIITQQLKTIYDKGDRLSLGVVWAVALVSLGMSFWYDTWIASLLVGLPAALVPTVVWKLMPATLVSRCTIAAAYMVQAATLIHQAHGMIEFHFAIFCLLAALIVYRDWKVIIAGAAVIAVHHLVFNFLQENGGSVYVFEYGTGFGLVMLHAAFVVFESAVLVVVALESYKDAVEAAETRHFGQYMVLQDGRINLDVEDLDAQSEFGRQFADYLNNLKQVASELNERTDAIHTAASEISSGNSDLSDRTEQQASALEQTSSSMQEMLGSVRNNADSARKANQLVNTARNSAEQGGSVVSEAMSAMREITQSSKRIGNITAVIDEIAFQTNLLALNAAVEAARAGEQGRGFAVVASEVRNLAGRSAEAAKEIKSLIDDSVAKIERGSQLVDRSGSTLSEIVDGVKEVSAIVSEIASASIEQSEGIGQVTQAVTSMDEMTQRNAALVEQAAASAKELESHSDVLAQMMQKFRLPSSALGWSGDRAPAAHARAAARGRMSPALTQPLAAAGADEDWETF